MAFSLTSPAFGVHAEIPGTYTCDGANRSPPLAWTGAPAETHSYALIVDDPDAPDPRAPRQTWVHWVLYDIPPSTTSLLEGIGSHDLPRGVREGRNDWKRIGYGGPCPPVGRHRYFHKLYALDALLGDLRHPSASQLKAAMHGHVLAVAELVGTYERTGPGRHT